MADRVKLTEAIAYWICPTLKDEVAALRSGNTKVILENQRLMDEIGYLKTTIPELTKQRSIASGRALLASNAKGE